MCTLTFAGLFSKPLIFFFSIGKQHYTPPICSSTINSPKPDFLDVLKFQIRLVVVLVKNKCNSSQHSLLHSSSRLISNKKHLETCSSVDYRTATVCCSSPCWIIDILFAFLLKHIIMTSLSKFYCNTKNVNIVQHLLVVRCGCCFLFLIKY